MAIINRAISYVDRKPGTVAVVGFTGVVLVSLINIGQILLYALITTGIIGLLIYSSREAKNKKAKKSSNKNKDYIL